jgi:hypothetical protein
LRIERTREQAELEKPQMNDHQITPDLSKVIQISQEFAATMGNGFTRALSDAKEYLLFYDWCREIHTAYTGIFLDGILSLFLFRIVPARTDVDEWIWVIAGDLPPAYLTCEECRTPAEALDGYIGAMTEWVTAASAGKSVAKLIPVNTPATPQNADTLKSRLEFLDTRILGEGHGFLAARYQVDHTR